MRVALAWVLLRLDVHQVGASFGDQENQAFDLLGTTRHSALFGTARPPAGFRASLARWLQQKVPLLVRQNRRAVLADQQAGSSQPLNDVGAQASPHSALQATPSPQSALHATPSSGHHDYGFYFQVFRSPKATLEVLRGVRAHFPTSPIYMVADKGGLDFTAMAQRFNCRFSMATRRFSKHNGPESGEHQSEDVRIWFDRLTRAAEYCNSTYLINLEDDIEVGRRPKELPPNDAGGVDLPRVIQMIEGSDTEAEIAPPGFFANLQFNEQIMGSIGQQWSYRSWGMCGGSYVRTAAFLQIMRDPGWWERVVAMKLLDIRVGVFDDVTLGAVMMNYSYTLLPWDESHNQIGSREEDAYYAQVGLKTPAFTHGDKQFFKMDLASSDGFAVEGGKVVVVGAAGLGPDPRELEPFTVGIL
jgi:hypothetical protein